jgi:hypothetical protein
MNTWFLGVFGSFVNEGVREEDPAYDMRTNAPENE